MFPMWLIISRKNYYRKRWVIIPILLSIYNAIMIPYEFSFGKMIKSQLLVQIIDNIIDVLFIVDMALQFLTTVIDKKGYEVQHPYQLAKRYISTWRFKFDLLSLLGNNLFRLIHPSFKYF